MWSVCKFFPGILRRAFCARISFAKNHDSAEKESIDQMISADQKFGIYERKELWQHL